MLPPLETKLLGALRDAVGGNELFPSGDGPDPGGEAGTVLARAERFARYSQAEDGQLAEAGRQRRAMLRTDMARELQRIIGWWKDLYPSRSDWPEDLGKWEGLVKEAEKPPWGVVPPRAPSPTAKMAGKARGRPGKHTRARLTR